MKTLKQFKSVFILTALLLTGSLFTSCDSDDDGGADQSIVGTWLLQSRSVETIVNGESQGVTQDTVDENNFVRITFNADGTFTDFYSDEFNGTVETESDSGTYSTDGNTITVMYDGETEVFEEEFVLTGNQLVITSSEEDTSNSTVYVYTSTFIRQ